MSYNKFMINDLKFILHIDLHVFIEHKFVFVGQVKLKNASVLVVGAGGLGCPAALYLAGAGVGHIGIVDYDEVEVTNLHRQLLFSTADVGTAKATAADVALTRYAYKIIICNFVVFL